jgi:hypothetical protein
MRSPVTGEWTTKVAVKTDLSQAAHIIPFRSSFGSPEQCHTKSQQQSIHICGAHGRNTL